jgi:dihydrofolate reductase
MRKIINATYITLDGVIENPHLWPAVKKGHDEKAVAIQTDLLNQCDTILMGRKTYEAFAPAWQSRAGDVFADLFNAKQKIVISKTLKNPDWEKTTVISKDVVNELEKIKKQKGKDIVQYGIGSVTTLLMENNLLDELRLWFYPLTIGKGSTKDTLFGRLPEAQFELTNTTVLKNGMIILTYKVLK